MQGTCEVNIFREILGERLLGPRGETLLRLPCYETGLGLPQEGPRADKAREGARPELVSSTIPRSMGPSFQVAVHFPCRRGFISNNLHQDLGLLDSVT